MINGRTHLHVVVNGTMTVQIYIDEVLLPHVRLFRGAVDSEGIQRLLWPVRSADLNPIENVWDALWRQVAGRNYPPTNKNTLIRALTEEWDKLPQQLLDNVVQSMDEVEKLACKLNEEAERTERPIRRLSKVMYGSTCADMQVDVMGECLSSIKHVVGRETANNQSVRRHLDAFTRGRIIGKLEEGRSVTSVAAEFGIAHSIVSRLWRLFQTTGTAIRLFSSGRPQVTKPADDRYIVLQGRRNRRQTAGEIARHTTQATGRSISCFTVARRLHVGGLFARHPVRCVPFTPAHRRRRSLWYQEHRNRRDNEWGRVFFTDESRFSLSSDSHRILI
ncbi:transposable element Tcb1 transposase [Trichonephila clavipes]|nr:transposable element Tcb1 transposase [Trichonephila clavipes]